MIIRSGEVEEWAYSGAYVTIFGEAWAEKRPEDTDEETPTGSGPLRITGR
ncbi:MAG: hypothetical protein IT225_02840 [Flavobacteriales bacterium]|nr:hypothetical protein [Flavobacteriales bacterium]